MAIGWLSVLQVVPWTDVINNAPRIAEGAKKLWKAASRQPAAPQDAAVPHTASADWNALQARTVQLEATIAELRSEMLASSELIQALADQNTQLIRRIEANRVRLTQLVAALVVTAALASAAIVLAAWRAAG